MNLRDLRKQSGLTAKQVAEKLGVAERCYYKYEKGELGLHIITAYKLSKIFGVTIDDIVESIINIHPQAL